MRKQEFSIEIKASREKVWNVLWDDVTFRDWASNIDEGMYLVGNMEETMRDRIPKALERVKELAER